MQSDSNNNKSENVSARDIEIKCDNMHVASEKTNESREGVFAALTNTFTLSSPVDTHKQASSSHDNFDCEADQSTASVGSHLAADPHVCAQEERDTRLDQILSHVHQESDRHTQVAVNFQQLLDRYSACGHHICPKTEIKDILDTLKYHCVEYDFELPEFACDFPSGRIFERSFVKQQDKSKQVSASSSTRKLMRINSQQAVDMFLKGEAHHADGSEIFSSSQPKSIIPTQQLSQSDIPKATETRDIDSNGNGNLMQDANELRLTTRNLTRFSSDEAIDVFLRDL